MRRLLRAVAWLCAAAALALSDMDFDGIDALRAAVAPAAGATVAPTAGDSE